MTLGQLQAHRGLVLAAVWGWLTVCAIAGTVAAQAAREGITHLIRALRRAA